jgi:hypothetical protein
MSCEQRRGLRGRPRSGLDASPAHASLGRAAADVHVDVAKNRVAREQSLL